MKDGETWHTLARQYSIPVETIIQFNFETLIPEHVNWYLRVITGCNRTTDDINWAFSNTASPGNVYIPNRVLDFEALDVPVRRSRRTPISRWFDQPKDPKNIVNLAGQVVDVAGAIDVALAVFAVELPLLAGLGLTALAAVGPMLVVGGAHQDAINYHIKEARLRGFSQGIVVGAFGKGTDFARINFLAAYRDFNSMYKDKRKTFENEYKRAFLAGYLTGRDFTTWERSQFLKHIHSYMKPHPKETYGEDRAAWSRSYFIESAAVFRRLHLR